MEHLSIISLSFLQRKLEYVKYTIGEVIDVVITQTATILLALKGFGVGSFVIGSLFGRIINFFIFFYLSPWPIGISFSLKKLKPFLPFGLNFQAINLIGAINGATVPLFVGTVSGTRAVGLINWASGIRQAGLAPFEMIQRIIFPAASRLQDSP